jgi:hypothetical protein
MLLSDLDPDVLLHIFCLTDVYTILTLSRVRPFYARIPILPTGSIDEQVFLRDHIHKTPVDIRHPCLVFPTAS